MEIKLNQEQFQQVIDILILFKQMNPKKDVYLNESSIKEAFHFMENIKSTISSNPGLLGNSV
jgi:hypothetical protein